MDGLNGTGAGVGGSKSDRDGLNGAGAGGVGPPA